MFKRYMITAIALLTLGLSVNSADAGMTERLWSLEKQKNAWLKRTFLQRDWSAPRIFRRG